MSHIHFIGGEKGGVGKSLMSRLLAQYFIDRQVPFVAFDTDRSHGALMRFYSEFAAPVRIATDGDHGEGLDRVVEAAALEPERRVLVDLAAQTQRSLAEWMTDSDLPALAAEMGITITYWHVMDAGRDSVDLLAHWLDGIGTRMKLVLVQNEVRGAGFELLDASGQKERALGMGAHVVRLRKLSEATMQRIDSHNTSFWAAVNQPDRAATGLGLLERQRIKVWLNSTYQEIDRVGV
jgi:hypothetical protein